MNCSGCREEPEEGEALRDCGLVRLVPFGVDSAKEGRYGLFFSGVLGVAEGEKDSPA